MRSRRRDGARIDLVALTRRYGRSRGLPRAVIICLVLAVVTSVLPTWIPLLLSSNQSSIRTTNLVGLLPALVLGQTLEVRLSEYELVFRRTLRLLTGWHLAFAVVVCAAVVGVALGRRVQAEAVLGGWFGALGFLGIGLLAARLGRGPSWSIPCAIAGVMYLMGSVPDGTVRPWAWYLLADPSPVKITIDTTLFLAGAVLTLSAGGISP